jgi:hypothetical protein
MAIQARTVVGAAGVFIVAAVAMGFTMLMPKPDATGKHASVQITEADQPAWSVEVEEAK